MKREKALENEPYSPKILEDIEECLRQVEIAKELINNGASGRRTK